MDEINQENNLTPSGNPAKAVAIKHPRSMWESTQSVISKLEAKLSGKVVNYYTDAPILPDDVKYFYYHLRNIGKQKKLFFVLTSGGGDGKSAYRIASLLRDFCDELTIVLPEKAASAATMLSLSADEIIMTPLSYLTAVDTSIIHPLNPKGVDGKPVRLEIEEVTRAVEVMMKNKTDSTDKTEIYKSIFNFIHPAAFGALERSSNLSEMLCSDILTLRKNKIDKEEATKLITRLNKGYPEHGYPITPKMAKELGLNVIESDSELNSLLWDLLNSCRLSSEPARTDFDGSHLLIETYTKSIESLGNRLAVLNIFERRLDPILKNWTTLRDEFKWVSLFEEEKDGKKDLRLAFF